MWWEVKDPEGFSSLLEATIGKSSGLMGVLDSLPLH